MYVVGKQTIKLWLTSEDELNGTKLGTC